MDDVRIRQELGASCMLKNKKVVTFFQAQKPYSMESWPLGFDYTAIAKHISNKLRINDRLRSIVS
ncbi:hypothetical protein BX666DRAFT_226200 [Dichotomocladium elegans]|nr:hypothetical protein BX666DRAFT_226200 [Dichotomocladium elegans]